MINFQQFWSELQQWKKPTPLSENSCWQLLFSASQSVKSILDYTNHRNNRIDFSLTEYYNNLLLHWLNEIPLARLTKEAYFANESWTVSATTFIPRHETETLITKLSNYLKTPTNFKYLDICSGSGALAITLLKKYNFSQSTLIDIDPIAIKDCQTNLSNHNCQATLITDDWTNQIPNFTAELITANFPYLSYKDPIPFTLLLNEPITALYAPENGCYHYNKLFEFLPSNPHWKIIALELSPYFQTELTHWLNICNKHNWSTKIFNDFQNHQRCLIITR